MTNRTGPSCEHQPKTTSFRRASLFRVLQVRLIRAREHHAPWAIPPQWPMRASCGLLSPILLRPAQKIKLINQSERIAVSNAQFQVPRQHEQRHLNRQHRNRQHCQGLPNPLTYLARRRQLVHDPAPRTPNQTVRVRTSLNEVAPLLREDSCIELFHEVFQPKDSRVRSMICPCLQTSPRECEFHLKR